MVPAISQATRLDYTTPDSAGAITFNSYPDSRRFPRLPCWGFRSMKGMAMELEFYRLSMGETATAAVDLVMTVGGEPPKMPTITHEDGVMRVAIYAGVYALPWELMFRMVTVMMHLQPDLVSFQGFDRRRYPFDGKPLHS